MSAVIVFVILPSRPFGLYLEALRNWAGASVNQGSSSLPQSGGAWLRSGLH
ncbi:MAG: hypothetical protein WD969_16420 [Paracoccaceae bacterium]